MELSRIQVTKELKNLLLQAKKTFQTNFIYHHSKKKIFSEILNHLTIKNWKELGFSYNGEQEGILRVMEMYEDTANEQVVLMQEILATINSVKDLPENSSFDFYQHATHQPQQLQASTKKYIELLLAINYMQYAFESTLETYTAPEIEYLEFTKKYLPSNAIEKLKQLQAPKPYILQIESIDKSDRRFQDWYRGQYFDQHGLLKTSLSLKHDSYAWLTRSRANLDFILKLGIKDQSNAPSFITEASEKILNNILVLNELIKIQVARKYKSKILDLKHKLAPLTIMTSSTENQRLQGIILNKDLLATINQQQYTLIYEMLRTNQSYHIEQNTKKLFKKYSLYAGAREASTDAHYNLTEIKKKFFLLEQIEKVSLNNKITFYQHSASPLEDAQKALEYYLLFAYALKIATFAIKVNPQGGEGHLVFRDPELTPIRDNITDALVETGIDSVGSLDHNGIWRPNQMLIYLDTMNTIQGEKFWGFHRLNYAKDVDPNEKAPKHIKQLIYAIHHDIMKLNSIISHELLKTQKLKPAASLSARTTAEQQPLLSKEINLGAKSRFRQ